MIYELEDTKRAEGLFEGWKDTAITSCLQRVMGKVYVTDLDDPRSAVAILSCFAFYAGKPDRELIEGRPASFLIMVPQSEAWGVLIEECFPGASKETRYAFRKDTRFDRARLEEMVAALPEGYELRRIDGELYDRCLGDYLFEDFVSAFGSKERYLELGRGMVVMRDGEIVAGASSFSRYREGIELEVDTVEEERRKGLASAVSAALILSCLEEGLFPSWDAANPISVDLARKLGYEFDHEYVCYEVE